jgi:hypothetical protein
MRSVFRGGERRRLTTARMLLGAAVAVLVTVAGVGSLCAQAARADAESTLASWPAKPQEVGGEMVKKYGQPDEVTASMLVWNGKGPWKRTILYREEVPHTFPMKHTDLLEQFIDYRVPPEKFDELARYDGSVIVERTKGEISARCDKEEMNFLALNLANDIVIGKRTVEGARDFYAKTAMAFKQGEREPYTQGLRFTVSKGGTADPDRPAPMK